MNDLKAVLLYVQMRKNRAPYSAKDITMITGAHDTFVKKTLKNLASMKMIVRHRSGYQYRIWETIASKVPDDLEEFITTYDAYMIEKRKGRL